jgi:nucleotide-binding universal stress UspA family protein
MDRSILCGLDGSPDSQAALAVAVELAAQLRLRLILANVVEPRHASSMAAASLVGAVPRPEPRSSRQQEAEANGLLAELAAATGVEQAERRVVVGYAAERLAELADEERAEMIVVGSRGRGAFKAAFLGSVSTSLIGVARCPVLVVPPGAAAAS